VLGRLAPAASNIYHTLTDRRFREFNRQRRILDLEGRRQAADRLAAMLPHSPPEAIAGHDEDAEAVARDGFVFLEPLISRPQIDEVRAYLAEHDARDRYRPHLGSFKAPDNVPPETHVSDYSQPVILGAPHLLAIANHPRVLAIVEKVLGAKPTIGSLSLWWSTPSRTGEPEHAELFHRDVDDLRFLKLFVYLTDVDEDSGPHIYAAGSHRMPVLSNIARFPEAEVVAAVGAERIKRFTGPAGTTFIENTYGLHRGLPPTKRPRLVFQPLYTLRPVIYGPKRPLRVAAGVPVDGLDPYVNRVFLGG
jgi:hypothetical protein